MNSNDIVIRTERTLNEIVIDIEGKITNISIELQEFRNSVSEKFTAQQKQIDSLTAEIRVINERITSVNDRLASMQWGVSFVSVMLVALPLVWGLRKFFSFSIRDAIREAVREELAQHTNQN